MGALARPALRKPAHLASAAGEKRLQWNHHAISDVFIYVSKNGPNRPLSPRPDLPDYQNICSFSFYAGARLDARGVKIEWYRVDIPSIEWFRRPPNMDRPVIRVYLDREVVTIR